MLCYAMLCYAMLCYAMLCYAMLCYAMLCYAEVLFSGILAAASRTVWDFPLVKHIEYIVTHTARLVPLVSQLHPHGYLHNNPGAHLASAFCPLEHE